MNQFEKKWSRTLALIMAHPSLVAIGILFCGMTLRMMFPLHIVINFDQVQILENAQQILRGDLTLIGPRTGPASMFTGPLIYYVTAAFVWLFGDVVAVIAVASMLSLLTGSALYFLTKKYIGVQEALLATLIWAFSPALIDHDKTLWNPSLLILSSTLLLIPILTKKSDRWIFPLLLLGAFLSYQAHFSGFFLFGLAVISIGVLRKPIRLLIPLVLGLMLSLLPTILFDFRNNFLNAKGLLSLAEGTGAFSLNSFFASVLENATRIFEIVGSLFFKGNAHSFVLIFGILTLVVALAFWKQFSSAKISVMWSVIITVFYALYSGEKPEYYYFLLVPGFLLVCSQLFPKLGKWSITLFLLLFISNSVWINIAAGLKPNNLHLGLLSNLRQELLLNPPGEIAYDIPLGSDYGARYMLKDVPLASGGQLVHITYPNTYAFSQITKYSDVAVWRDPRVGSDNFVTTNEYILRSPASIYLYADSYPPKDPPAKPTDAYVIIKNAQHFGQLLITKSEHTQIEWVAWCRDNQQQDNPSQWIQLDSKSFCSIRGSFALKIMGDQLSTDEMNIEVL